jgi:hypothetical protein
MATSESDGLTAYTAAPRLADCKYQLVVSTGAVAGGAAAVHAASSSKGRKFFIGAAR